MGNPCKREGAIGIMIVAALLSLLLLAFVSYGCGEKNGKTYTDGGKGIARFVFFTQPG